MFGARFLGATLLLLAGCPKLASDQSASTSAVGSTDEANHTSKKGVAQPMQTNLTDIDTLKGLIGTESAAFVARFGIKPEQLRSGARYEAMTGLIEIHAPEISPARFFFQGDKLTLIYLIDPPTLHQQNAQAVESSLGVSGGTELRSRAGKSSTLHAYPEKGVAFSMDTTVDFVELFAPISLAEYQRSIYVDPGAFTK